MSDFVTVAKVGAIAEGQGDTFTVGERLIAVFNIDGQYHAIDDLCPHMGASLGQGHVEEGVVACPWHVWRFRVSDGTWCDNPKLKVKCFEVRVEGDEIQVRSEPIPVDNPVGSSVENPVGSSVENPVGSSVESPVGSSVESPEENNGEETNPKPETE